MLFFINNYNDVFNICVNIKSVLNIYTCIHFTFTLY